jgi:hypothetical protein
MNYLKKTEPNLCRNNLTIKFDHKKGVQSLLNGFYCYSNEQFQIKEITESVLHCVFITTWYPDFDMLEQLVKTHGCWLKNEWQEDGGMQGVWIGYMDQVIHIKKLEWLNLAHTVPKK